MLEICNNNTRLWLHYNFLGYNDYLAARHLLFNKFSFVGIIMVCTAIEKYFKAALAVKNQKAKQLHLDRLSEFFKILKKNGVKLEDKVDGSFMELLSNVYKLRYFDNVQQGKGVSYGFFVNQIICEMDYIINLIEYSIEMKTSSGKDLKSNYKKDFEEGNLLVCDRNYLAEKIDKKEFMEKGSFIYIIRVMDDGHIMEMNSTRELYTKYNGKICLASMSDLQKAKN